MAIINMITVSKASVIARETMPEYPEGAYSPFQWNYTDDNNNVVIYESHKGLCVKDRERNMHDDSDFFMTVYNPESDTFEEILFASTRGWTYPCMESYIDANEEIQAKYKAFCEQRINDARKQAEKREQKELNNLLDNSNITHEEFDKLAAVYGPVTAKKVTALLSKRVRSSFKKSLAQQVRNWLDGNSNYDRPLSPKQLQYV